MKKILVGVLVLALTFCSLTGCGEKAENQGGGTAKDIEISVWDSGLGTEWLDNAIEEFEKEHPEYNVYYSASADGPATLAAFGMGEVDTVDLYFSAKSLTSGNKDKECLDDLLDSTADGDAKTIREKFDDAYLLMETEQDGKIYDLTYGGGTIGIVYNKALFEKAGIQTLPRTTDELALVCSTLLSQNIVPFCHCVGQGYWSYLVENWYGQYEGMDYYLDTFYGEASKDTFLKKDARYEILKAMEKLVPPQNVLNGSISGDHTTMQTKLLMGEAAMMVNGSWLQNEMASIGEVDNFLTMKTPVLSSITDKLTSVKKEVHLRNLIDAVDAVTEGTKKIEEYKVGNDYKIADITVSAADWDYVYAARNTVPNNYSGLSSFIPTYSNAKEGAKEFLKYLYSDKGYQTYIDTLHIKLPMSLSKGEIDTTSWSAFEQNQAHLLETTEQFFTWENSGKNRIFTDGGAQLFAELEYVNVFCSKSAEDRLSADEAWNKLVEEVNHKYEKTWMANVK